jgi:hypothetical protein
MLGIVFIKLFSVGLSHLKMPATEQRVNIKFCDLLHKSPSQTLQRLEEVYDKVAMKKIEVCNWHECFHEDHESVSDDPHFG